MFAASAALPADAVRYSPGHDDMKALPPLLCAMALLLSAGCATRPPLETPKLLEITPSKTTRAEVESALGKPDDWITGSNRKTLTVYRDASVRTKVRLLKDEYDMQFLTAFFLFDDGGVLEKKLISETGTKSTTKFGVRTVGQPVSDEQIAQIKPRETRYEEAFAILGPPLAEALTLDGQIVREWAFLRQAMFSRMRGQVITAIFDYDTDVIQEFAINDDVPAEKKKAVK
jgi:hypothetical protein